MAAKTGIEMVGGTDWCRPPSNLYHLPNQPIGRNTMIKFKLSDAMHDEYMCREIDHPVYHHLIAGGPGVYELTVEEAKEVRSDAEYYCDPYGPAEYLTVGMRAAYRSVRNQMTKQLAAHAVVQESMA
jgi:hypothetical protein